MTWDLPELLTPRTRHELEASIYEVLEHIGARPSHWRPGSPVRALITAGSIVLAGYSKLSATVARGGFLELAEGPWLTALARYVYGVERFEAAPAAGEVTLVNAGGGFYELDAGDLVVSNPSTGHTYRNTQPFRLRMQETVTTPIRATEAGAESSALAGAITAIESPALLQVTCSNALAVIGQDAETDADLRTRCREAPGARSPFGPESAYEFHARNAKGPDGAPARVTRVLTRKAPGGNVTVYVAMASGAVPGDAGDPTTALGAVAAHVVRWAVPEAITATVRSARVVVVNVTYEVWAYETAVLTEAEVLEAVGHSLAAFFSRQPIGGSWIAHGPGKLFGSALISAIGSARPEIFRVHVSDPPPPEPPEEYSIPLAIDQIPVLGAVVGTVHLMPPPQEQP